MLFLKHNLEQLLYYISTKRHACITPISLTHLTTQFEVYFPTHGGLVDLDVSWPASRPRWAKHDLIAPKACRPSWRTQATQAQN